LKQDRIPGRSLPRRGRFRAQKSAAPLKLTMEGRNNDEQMIPRSEERGPIEA
jgi:hypothetical protein